MTIHDLPVLVIGAGRIGSAVAMRLRGLGARVTVSARREADFAHGMDEIEAGQPDEAYLDPGPHVLYGETDNEIAQRQE